MQLFKIGIGRLINKKGFGIIQTLLSPKKRADLIKEVGMLVMFNPYKCTGSYIFDYHISEEKVACNILMELNKSEKGIKEAKVNGEAVETAQLSKQIKKDSIVEFLYQPEVEMNDVKDEIGLKYLNWKNK